MGRVYQDSYSGRDVRIQGAEERRAPISNVHYLELKRPPPMAIPGPSFTQAGTFAVPRTSLTPRCIASACTRKHFSCFQSEVACSLDLFSLSERRHSFRSHFDRRSEVYRSGKAPRNLIGCALVPYSAHPSVSA